MQITPRSLILLIALAFTAAAYAHFDHRPLPAPVKTTAPRPARPLTGEELIRKYDCTYCHMTEAASDEDVDDPERNCAACHMLAGVQRFRATNFDGLAARLRPEWMREYLANPHSVRTHMRESMPHFNLKPEEIDAIVTRLIERAPVVPAEIDPEYARRDPLHHQRKVMQGIALARKYRCGRCHDFTGMWPPVTGNFVHSPYSVDMSYFAPDFRYTRERMKPEHVAGFIRKSGAYDPLSTMPRHPYYTEEELGLLTYLILFSDLSPTEPPPATERKPVEHPQFTKDIAPLLQKYCVFCHYPQESTRLGKATGFAGGFALEARRLDLTSYEGLMRGVSKDDGGKYDVVIPGYEHSILLQRLRGDMTPQMPFGSKMAPADIQTFENWVKDGAPGPPADAPVKLHPPGE